MNPIRKFFTAYKYFQKNKIPCGETGQLKIKKMGSYIIFMEDFKWTIHIKSSNKNGKPCKQDQEKKHLCFLEEWKKTFVVYNLTLTVRV